MLAAGTALAAACGAAPAGDAPVASIEARAGTPAVADSGEGGPRLADSGASVRLGIDVLLAANADVLRGRRVGLITNHTGRNAAGESTIDLLHEHPAVELVALFSPEHGIRDTAEAGERVESGRDARTG
ncbi:MAG TPA: exo-beta-N-acetylmuramidase NamZ domain-containing protein, partial [Nannocystis sp.]